MRIEAIEHRINLDSYLDRRRQISVDGLVRPLADDKHLDTSLSPWYTRGASYHDESVPILLDDAPVTSLSQWGGPWTYGSNPY
jgi:hypothetical protein